MLSELGNVCSEESDPIGRKLYLCILLGKLHQLLSGSASGGLYVDILSRDKHTSAHIRAKEYLKGLAVIVECSDKGRGC